MISPKLWICGICQNNADSLEQILHPLKNFIWREENKYHLSTIWVDGGSNDSNKTVDIMCKYGGILLRRKWTNDHDFQMNEYLRCGLIKHGDWVIQLDTSERLNPNFINTLQTTMLKNFEDQNINMVYQRSKPLLFKWHDDQIFSGSPHWGLQNQRRYIVDISKFDGFEKDEDYCWSLRDDINKWITNGMKYYYVYGRSNHMWLVYNPANYPNSAQNLIQKHEIKRMEFRDYCRNELGLSMDNLDDITHVLKMKQLPPKLVEYMNYEKVIANYYRYLRGEKQQHIYDTQNSWKYVENT